MKVFMPYLVWNTVFDNTRVTSELGRKPVPFSQYSYPLLKFSRESNFSYPYQDWPATVGGFRGMMDLVLEAWVSALIEKSKAGWMLGKGKPWQPGEKLKLLFAGYNGTRNMGSDVRVEEMLRQLRHILGAERVAFSVMTQVPKFSAGVFRGYGAGASAGYLSSFLIGRSAQTSRRGGLRRFDVQEQVRQRADHDDDWIVGHCGGAEQAFGGLWC